MDDFQPKNGSNSTKISNIGGMDLKKGVKYAEGGRTGDKSAREHKENYKEGFDALWALIKDADINRFIVCAGTKDARRIKNLENGGKEEEINDNDSNEKDKNQEKIEKEKLAKEEAELEDYVINKYGLYPNFCYTLLNIAEVNGIKLVRLRNCKGSIEWRGAWGDESPEWQKVEKEFRTEVKRDGIFYAF